MQLVFASFLILLRCTSSSSSEPPCPSRCTCLEQRVECIRQSLRIPPRDFNPETASLNISGNQIVQLEVNFASGLDKLLYLNASHNQIAAIESGTFSSTTSLRVLDLSNNRLTSLASGHLNGLSRITEIDLSHNKLTSIDSAFDGFTSLSRLDLHNNKLALISESSLKSLTSLRHLVLSGNRIERIENNAFKDLDKLLYLVLKGNKLNQLSRLDHLSKSLSYLDLSECQLVRVPRGLAGGLRYLQLRRNNITELSRDSFADCSNINILLLDENKINSIEKDTFAPMQQLQQLWLNDNKLDSLPKNLPASLQRLLVDSNKITEVTDDVFVDKSQVVSFSIVGNNISKIAPNSFAKLASLSSLDISNNRLRRVPPNLFRENQHLVNLVLSRNPLFYLNSLAKLNSLKELALSFVETDPDNLSPDFFNEMKDLSKLDLDSSPNIIQAFIKQVETSSVSVDHLKELGLQGSGLSTLSRRFVENLPSLMYMRLSSGKWDCDSNLLWMRDWFKFGGVKIETVEDNRCFSPRKLHGKQITNLLDSDMDIEENFNVVENLKIKSISTLKNFGKQTKSYPAETINDNHSKKKQDKIITSKTVTLGSQTYSFDNARSATAATASPQPQQQTAYNAHNNFIKISPIVVLDQNVLNEIEEQNFEVIETNEAITGSALLQPVSEEAHDGFGYVIIAVVIVITAIVAVLIIFLIFATLRRKSHPPIPHDPSLPSTVIKYQNKDGVLYFSTASRANGAANNNEDVGNNDEATNHLDYSSRCSGSLRKINASENGGSRTRMYKWEET